MQTDNDDYDLQELNRQYFMPGQLHSNEDEQAEAAYRAGLAHRRHERMQEQARIARRAGLCVMAGVTFGLWLASKAVAFVINWWSW